MTDNAGCVFPEMRGNAASYKDKKSVPAFYLIGLHQGRVILHNAQSGSLRRPESKCQREEKDRVEGDLNPKPSLEIYNGRVNHCPYSISPSNVWGPLEQGASYVYVCSHVWICFPASLAALSRECTAVLGTDCKLQQAHNSDHNFHTFHSSSVVFRFS